MKQISKETLKKLTSLTRGFLDSKGREIPNPKPTRLRSNLERPPTLQEQIKRVLRTELSQDMIDQGQESWEEANDFDVKDDFETDLIDTQYTLMEEEIPVSTETEIPEEPPETPVVTPPETPPATNPEMPEPVQQNIPGTETQNS